MISRCCHEPHNPTLGAGARWCRHRSLVTNSIAPLRTAGVGATLPSAPRSPKARNPSVDAPSQARENFRIVVARSRMLPSVRPLTRRWSAAGLYGSSRAGSITPVACWKHSGFLWFSRPRLTDRCAILSFRSPYAPAVAIGLRRCGRSPVNTAFDQESPDHSGHLVGQGHDDQHLRFAGQHLRQP
jgi:hypothetical protein